MIALYSEVYCVIALYSEVYCVTLADEWVAPLEVDAFRPEPLGSHAFSKFDSHQAVLFGGNNSLVYTNTCYLFDLDTRVSS